MADKPALDAMVVDPDKFSVRFENERVRVLEASIPPGEGHGMHWHPQHLVYTLSAYEVQDTFPDGSTKNMERDAGEVLWGEELSHATDNVGETAVHALIIEFNVA
jgi:hypothetical protein